MGDPITWKTSFIRAMNHLANCSARPRQCESADAVSDCNASLAASRITEGTLASEKRAQMACEKCDAMEATQAEPEWDRSTRAGDEAAVGRSLAQCCPEDFLRKNPSLAYVHSMQSLKAMIGKQKEILKSQACM
jgi:hypothetical protein